MSPGQGPGNRGYLIMGAKLKIIIIALIILLAGSLFVIFYFQNSNLTLQQEYEQVAQKLQQAIQENDELVSKLKGVLA